MENDQEAVQKIYSAIKEYGLRTVLYKALEKNFSVSIPFSQTACEITIEAAELSVRAYNCLKRAGINTIMELIDAVQSDKLLTIRNLGKKSLVEIKTSMLCIGYTYLSEKGKQEFISDLIERNRSKIKLSLLNEK